MSPSNVPFPTPIAVDPGYLIRDNQFWYAHCAFADLLTEAAEITLNVTGLGVRVLTRAAQGKNPKPTMSFTLPDHADRRWWETNRGLHVRVELLATGGTLPPTTASAPPPGVPSMRPAGRLGSTSAAATSPKANIASGGEAKWAGSVLCIGLDVAWFGGSATKPDSQHDCLAWALLHHRPDEPLVLAAHFARIALPDRDPDARRLLTAVEALLSQHSLVRHVVFAVDAPLQAVPRPHLPPRVAVPVAGTIERRACEEWLSQERQRIDRATGGSGDWHPNIQPGAPLPPRVTNLLAGLDRLGFSLWTEANPTPLKLVIECFPAEAIWAMKRLNRFPEEHTAAMVKSYKNQEGSTLTGQQVAALTCNVLNGFAADSGYPAAWSVLVEHAIDWMCSDATLQEAPGQYRGGKLLDDVVDSMICLATSLSYAHGRHHVWQDIGRRDDGHIIGPGSLCALL